MSNDKIRDILKNSGQIYWVCSCIDYTEELEAEYVHGIYEKLKSIFNLNCINPSELSTRVDVSYLFFIGFTLVKTVLEPSSNTSCV